MKFFEIWNYKRIMCLGPGGETNSHSASPTAPSQHRSFLRPSRVGEFLPISKQAIDSAVDTSRCPLIHFSSDTVYLQVLSDPPNRRLSPQDLPHFRPSGKPRTSSWLKLGFSQPLLKFEEFARTSHRVQGNTVYSPAYYKGYFEGYK